MEIIILKESINIQENYNKSQFAPTKIISNIYIICVILLYICIYQQIKCEINKSIIIRQDFSIWNTYCFQMHFTVYLHSDIL